MAYADPEQKREADKRYRVANREKRNESMKTWYRANREKTKEKRNAIYAANKAWRAANPERVRAVHRAWRVTNAEKVLAVHRAWRAANAERVKAVRRAWIVANPEKVSEHRKTRRALEHSASILGPFTAAMWRSVKRSYRNRCAYCGTRSIKADRSTWLTQDHVTPLSKGGAHTIQNIVPCCRSCNSRKGVGSPLAPVSPLLL